MIASHLVVGGWLEVGRLLVGGCWAVGGLMAGGCWAVSGWVAGGWWAFKDEFKQIKKQSMIDKEEIMRRSDTN